MLLDEVQDNFLYFDSIFIEERIAKFMENRGRVQNCEAEAHAPLAQKNQHKRVSFSAT
jgi:hypothetical protein